MASGKEESLVNPHLESGMKKGAALRIYRLPAPSSYVWLHLGIDILELVLDILTIVEIPESVNGSDSFSAAVVQGGPHLYPLARTVDCLKPRSVYKIPRGHLSRVGSLRSLHSELIVVITGILIGDRTLTDSRIMNQDRRTARQHIVRVDPAAMLR